MIWRPWAVLDETADLISDGWIQLKMIWGPWAVLDETADLISDGWIQLKKICRS
jgi:hypothetical protein